MSPEPTTTPTGDPPTWSSTTHYVDPARVEIGGVAGHPDQAVTLLNGPNDVGTVRLSTATAIVAGGRGDWHAVLDELERIGRQIVREVDVWRVRLARAEVEARQVDPCGGGDLPAEAEEVGA